MVLYELLLKCVCKSTTNQRVSQATSPHSEKVKTRDPPLTAFQHHSKTASWLQPQRQASGHGFTQISGGGRRSKPWWRLASCSQRAEPALARPAAWFVRLRLLQQLDGCTVKDVRALGSAELLIVS